MASLSAGIDLKTAVQLPQGEDLNDWLAVHAVDFYNRVNLIYGTVAEECTEVSCPKMSGGSKYEYQWADKGQYKKPTSLPAREYIHLLMDWVETQISDEELFPTDSSRPFPKTYLASVKKIFTRLFRVFVHVYIHHFEHLVSVGAEAHVNTCYKHFFYFVNEFALVDKKELEPLDMPLLAVAAKRRFLRQRFLSAQSVMQADSFCFGKAADDRSRSATPGEPVQQSVLAHCVEKIVTDLI
uniref:MOB kinase activator-like 2 n=1 Tax=Macrostomum lignano TaxID=282301 RepID=A0A1I8IPG6_9PLAT